MADVQDRGVFRLESGLGGLSRRHARDFVQRALASSAWTSPSMLPVRAMTSANWVW